MIKKLFKFKKSDNQVREAIEDLIEEAGDKEHFSEQEQEILSNVLYLKDKKCFNVMTPRADMLCFQKDGSVFDLASLMVQEGRSRVPVYGESVDEILGIVHIIDLAKLLLQNDDNMKVADILETEVKMVGPNVGVLDLLRDLQNSKVHMAMVVNEYGGTEGLVTIEDLLEEIVGDIEDEYDEEERHLITLQGKNMVMADTGATLKEVKEAIGVDLEARIADKDLEIHTLGGYVFQLAGRIPDIGEIIENGDINFKIMDTDPRRIKKVMIIFPEKE